MGGRDWRADTTKINFSINEGHSGFRKPTVPQLALDFCWGAKKLWSGTLWLSLACTQISWVTMPWADHQVLVQVLLQRPLTVYVSENPNFCHFFVFSTKPVSNSFRHHQIGGRSTTFSESRGETHVFHDFWKMTSLPRTTIASFLTRLKTCWCNKSCCK